MALQFGFKSLKQGESVRSCAGKSCENVSASDSADLAGVAFHDGLTHRNLPIAEHDEFSALADGENGCAMPNGGVVSVVRHGE